jgi:hypothetical protein
MRKLASVGGTTVLLVPAIACLLVVSACQTTEDQLSEPITQTPKGDFTHPGANITFPESIGDFERVEVTQYDKSGKDMSVGYNLDSPDLIAATVYVYPGRQVRNLGGGSGAVAAAKDILDEEQFKGSKEAILATTPGLTLVSEDESFVIANPGERTGRRAIFEGQGQIAGKPTVLRSEVGLFGFGDWFIKYRFTYPGESTTAPALILDFMNSLEWPAD